MTKFDWLLLTPGDFELANTILQGDRRDPDRTIAPDGNPYLYRWHLVRTMEASVYFHIQVASDPQRPLHDHPWDNFTTILSGGYNELYTDFPSVRKHAEPYVYPIRELRKGATVARAATTAHRLILPGCIPYTMTLFSTGPNVRTWGFWYPDGWKPYTAVTKITEDGRSVHVEPGEDR